jgi:hypothetical protein
MIYFKSTPTLLLVVVCLLVPSILKAQSQNDCDDLNKISIEVINTDGSAANGQIIFHAEGINLSKYNCLLFAKKKTDNRVNFKVTDGTIDHLKPGTYTLFVQDNSEEGCTKQFSIKIN